MAWNSNESWRVRSIASAGAESAVGTLRHADCVEQCPRSRAKQKAYAHTEFFSVRPLADIDWAIWLLPYHHHQNPYCSA